MISEDLDQEFLKLNNLLEDAQKEVQQLRMALSNLDQANESTEKTLEEIERKAEFLENELGIEKKLKEAEEVSQLIEDLNLKKETLTSEYQSTSNQMSLIYNNLAEQKEMHRQVEKSSVLREKLEKMSTLDSSIKTMSDELDHYNPDRLRQTFKLVTAEADETYQKLSVKLGERKANHEWCLQYETDIKAPKFKNLKERHIEAVMETEAELMAIRDLQKFHGVLDKAIMNYHTSKMHEINKIIKELWKDIYTGNDIEYIIIRSDTEETASHQVMGQRSYHYRVLMVKDDIEFEMRGRCSAGQKVLASIVIRLALAECFCINCGILALDEPTTNLDQNNMEGLARAIANLIEVRRNCANFQLILITHDEDFVRMLNRFQPCDTYYRVTKNKLGYSTICASDIRSF